MHYEVQPVDHEGEPTCKLNCLGDRIAKRCLVPLAAAIMLWSLIICTMAKDKGSQGNPGVLPPNSKPHGLSYSE